MSEFRLKRGQALSAKIQGGGDKQKSKRRQPHIRKLIAKGRGQINPKGGWKHPLAIPEINPSYAIL